MRCRACNEELSDFEATRRSINTWDYIELCNPCFRAISSDVASINRHDLMTLSDSESLDYVDNYFDKYDDDLA